MVMEDFTPLEYTRDALGSMIFGDGFLIRPKWPIGEMQDFSEGLLAIHWHSMRNLVTRTRKRADKLEADMQELYDRKSCTQTFLLLLTFIFHRRPQRPG